jgi:hypothetical protein
MAWNGSLGDAAQGQTVLGQEVISVCDPQQPVSVDAALVTLERAPGCAECRRCGVDASLGAGAGVTGAGAG